MIKILIPALAIGALASTAMAGEPVTLTEAQLDNVAAGFTFQSNKNSTYQVAAASAHAQGGCIVAACVGWGANGNASASAYATNVNHTTQLNID
jgi:hypothetical protein